MRVDDMADKGTLGSVLEPVQTDLKIVQGLVRRFIDDSEAAASSMQESLQSELRAALRQLRTDAQIAQAELDAAIAYDRTSYLKAAHELLDGWRARLDTLKVQADLARMGARDRARELIATGEDAWTAASGKLAEAEADAGASLEAARKAAEDALRGVGAATRTALDAVNRHLTQER